MKRFIALVTGIILIIGLLALLPGCGNDTGKAKEYMNAGDDVVDELKDDSEGLVEDMQTILTDMSAGTYSTSAQMEEVTSDFKASVDDLFEKADEATQEYDKILDLKGVDDYAEYAKLMNDLIENNKDAIQAFIDMLDGSIELAKMAESGQQVSTSDFEELGTEFGESFEDSTSKSEDLEKEAEELKKDKNL